MMYLITVIALLYAVLNSFWLEFLSNNYRWLTRWQVLFSVILFPATIILCTLWILIKIWDIVNNFMSKDAW